MNILLLGSGGREHALAWKMKQSPLLNNLFIAPGNAGTALCGTNLSFGVSDFDAIKKTCLEHHIHMLVAGSEESLVKGVHDFFLNDKELKHIPVIGPMSDGAQLEGSKAFSKEFMKRHHIPTAAYASFTSEKVEEGKRFLDTLNPPYVLKADGLAAGKGVLILNSKEEAKQNLAEMLSGKSFGDAGRCVVIEEFLSGIEASVFVLSDGESYLILPEAKDYKRIGEGDTGLNTGGMGAVSPVVFANQTFMKKVENRIIIPTIEGLKKEKIIYKGFIFFGLIKVGEEPFVIEYNCRMGDPETEAVMPRIKNDLVKLFQAVAHTTLKNETMEIDPRHATTVVLVAGGYPQAYRKGDEIKGLEAAGEALVFHAGTKNEKDQILTNGGRVLAVTGMGNNAEEALQKAMAGSSKIIFKDKYFRKDIGKDLLSMQ